MKYFQFGLVLSIIVAGPAAVYIFQHNSAIPTTFDKTFSATGLVEKMHWEGSRCKVKVALYQWTNLSNGFVIATIPKQNDRFLITAKGDICNAVSVAKTGSGNHIAFTVGETKGKWYFVDSPLAAASCGGLAINWQPEPEKH
jgi:hypothetical protein